MANPRYQRNEKRDYEPEDNITLYLIKIKNKIGSVWNPRKVFKRVKNGNG